MSAIEFQNSKISNSNYKYRASGYFIIGNEKFVIDYINFRSIVIDHNYMENNMPLMYAILNLNTKVVDKIIRNKDTGVFIINIQKCIDNSVELSDLWMDYINDTFVYFTTDDINKTEDIVYDGANTDREDIYREITLGLLSQTLVNNNKRIVNGILACNDMASAVAYVLGDKRKVVIEPFENNPPIKRLILPPKNSIAKSIEYLNSINTFYNSKYVYYMDYDVTYLVSSKGKAVPRKGDKANTVMLFLRNEIDPESKLQGITFDEKNRYYTIDIAGSNAELADYRECAKKYTKVNYTTTSGESTNYTKIEKKDTDNFVNKTTQVRVPNDNAGLILNNEKVTEIYFSINKIDLDTSIFTINREFVINADEVYKESEYSGRYLLRRKRELFFKSSSSNGDDRMTLSTLLIFEKVYEEKK